MFQHGNCGVRVPPGLKVNIQVNREGPKDEAEVGAWSEVIWQGVVGGGNWGESEEEGHWPRGKGVGKIRYNIIINRNIENNSLSKQRVTPKRLANQRSVSFQRGI